MARSAISIQLTALACEGKKLKASRRTLRKLLVSVSIKASTAARMEILQPLALDVR